MTAKQHAPATQRNRDPIAAVLAQELPVSGTVLEIAAGTGEHAIAFAQRFAGLEWIATDPSPDALASIAAYRDESALPNLRAPLMLDAASPDRWPIEMLMRSCASTWCISLRGKPPLGFSGALRNYWAGANH